MLPTILLHVIIFLYGIVIGSFLNVVIYRTPLKENIVSTRSHCMTCGYQLKWYDLVPLFSFLVLGGRCRKCKTKLSVQYPLVEGLNGVMYLVIFTKFGISVESLLYCLLFSALLALSVIDFRTYEIPLGINIFILMLGLVRVATDLGHLSDYLIGFLAVSVFLYILYRVSDGNWVGGGDVKLMAVCGLLLGWKMIIMAFVLGCCVGSVLHIIRMKITGEGRTLALGPYLSTGVMLVALWGEQMIDWYLRVCLGL